MLPPDSVSPVSTPPPPPPPPPKVEIQTKQSDTLQTLAKQYGVSDEQIAKANPAIVNPDHPLLPGTHVFIPVGDGAGVAKTYAVKPGDDLAGIAKQNNVSEQALREANHLGPGENVYPNEQLLLPAGGKSEDPTSPDALQKAFPSLQKFPAEKIKTISEAAQQLRDGTAQEKLSAAFTLAKEVPPENLPELLKKFGVQDKAIAKLASDKDALGALQTLTDPKASVTDKISAALTLTNSIGSLAPGDLAKTLKPYLAALPAGPSSPTRSANTSTRMPRR